jgi:CheY-like chemotaxis protein
MDHPTHPPAILVVDDDSATLFLLTYYMGTLAPKYEILAADNAHSALLQLGDRTVVLLITDYMMPGMDGLHLTAAVKQASPTTYVILTSADDSAELKQQARDQQVDTFLSKTDILNGLKDVVRSVLPANDAD